MDKFSSGTQLDWAAVTAAAKKIQHIADDAPYTAPEATTILIVKIRDVCSLMNEIAKALLITQSGSAR